MASLPRVAAHRFLINLRVDTASQAFRAALDPAGYLVPGNAPSADRRRAQQLAGEGVDVMADNGHFDDIRRIADSLAGEAERLHRLVDGRERQLGRSVRPGELEPTASDGYRRLARRAAAEGRQATAGRARTLADQQAVTPTRLVGAEDISMAVWLALDIEPAYLQLPRRDYRRINETVARLAKRELDQLPAALGRGYYAVASAVDHNSAFDAGRAFAAAGLDRAAMGFGAYMADDNSSDYAIVGRRRLDLGARMPNRYLRTALVARGFWDGYRDAGSRPPKAFHFLGLGAPIMMGPVALAGFGTELLSYDATSPIRDAVEGTLYLSAPAPLKVHTRRIAQQLASRARARNRTAPARSAAPSPPSTHSTTRPATPGTKTTPANPKPPTSRPAAPCSPPTRCSQNPPAAGFARPSASPAWATTTGRSPASQTASTPAQAADSSSRPTSTAPSGGTRRPPRPRASPPPSASRTSSSNGALRRSQSEGVRPPVSVG